jgi:hypothetical protein
VLIDGSPWTKEQLFKDAPIFNKHADHFQASLIVIVDTLKSGEIDFIVAPPEELAKIAIERGRAWLAHPLKNGGERKMFRKELPRSLLSPWRNAWWLLNGASPGSPGSPLTAQSTGWSALVSRHQAG